MNIEEYNKMATTTKTKATKNILSLTEIKEEIKNLRHIEVDNYLNKYDLELNNKIKILDFLRYINVENPKKKNKKFELYLLEIMDKINKHSSNQTTNIYNHNEEKVIENMKVEEELIEEFLELEVTESDREEEEEEEEEEEIVEEETETENEEEQIKKEEWELTQMEIQMKLTIKQFKEEIRKQKDIIYKLKNPPKKSDKELLLEQIKALQALNVPQNMLDSMLLTAEKMKDTTVKTSKKNGEIKNPKRNKKFAERDHHKDFVCPYDNFIRTKKDSILTHIHKGNGGCKRFKLLQNGKDLDAEKEKIIEDIKNFNETEERTETNYTNYNCKTEEENKIQKQSRLDKLNERVSK